MRRIRTALAAVALTFALVAVPLPAHATTEGTVDETCDGVNALLERWGWQLPC